MQNRRKEVMQIFISLWAVILATTFLSVCVITFVFSMTGKHRRKPEQHTIEQKPETEEEWKATGYFKRVRAYSLYELVEIQRRKSKQTPPTVDTYCKLIETKGDEVKVEYRDWGDFTTTCWIPKKYYFPFYESFKEVSVEIHKLRGLVDKRGEEDKNATPR
jgi:cbb3-type cytochrome oxidase subunit 3